ncbi:MAG: sigma-70 family RNA polymerase sigma factor, partial [Alphaproteobacteria bacterium]|nr:sigma-70 family RNA polymerase sigma factor [Alphaproteobacteria bacterium]
MLRRKPSHQISLSGLEDVLQDTGENQDAQIISLQKKEQIRQAVQFLPDRQRMAVVLCYFEEMSNSQAAAVMGVHIKALEGLLVRARKKLRERLGEIR